MTHKLFMAFASNDEDSPAEQQDSEENPSLVVPDIDC
jgi:hypothetical protein